MLIVVAITHIRMIINRSLLHFYRFHAFSFTFILSIYLCLFCTLTVLANDNYSNNSGAISNPARAESHLYSSRMTLLTFLRKSGGLLSRLLVRLYYMTWHCSSSTTTAFANGLNAVRNQLSFDAHNVYFPHPLPIVKLSLFRMRASGYPKTNGLQRQLVTGSGSIVRLRQRKVCHFRVVFWSSCVSFFSSSFIASAGAIVAIVSQWQIAPGGHFRPRG